MKKVIFDLGDQKTCRSINRIWDLNFKDQQKWNMYSKYVDQDY